MLTLVLVPVGFNDHYALKWLQERISDAYANITVLVASMPLQPPMNAYDWRRRQYRSETVLEKLAELKDNIGADILLAIVSTDAYANNLNFVFGQALLGKGVAVVYTPRLMANADYTTFLERLLKEALHELGHSLGLDHCINSLCVMHFSNTVTEVDRKTPRYCRRCSQALAARGVKVTADYTL